MGITRYLPIAEWLPSYDREWLRPDLFAGLTVWALVVPQAIAYAQIAGLPPEAGVFASFAAPLGYALFGTSRQMVCSPTSATAAISAALVAPVVAGNPEDFAAMSAALAIMSGAFFVALGKLRMGFISQFIASSVQIGFLFGLGLTIIIGQLFKVFGFDGIDGPFYEQAWHLLKHLGDTSGWTLLIGGGSLVAISVLNRLFPALPAALLLVGISTVLVSLASLDEKGVAVVGQVDRAVPLPSIPLVDAGQLLTLAPGTLAIVVVGYAESISVARRFADEHRYDIRPDQELTALGVSSAMGGLFQGFITSGGASQSAANDQAGAKTQVSSLVLAALAALTAILLLPLFEHLPLAVLGAIVINAVLGFINVAALRRVHRLRRDSTMLAALALGGVLVFGILPGLLITVAMSILLVLSRFGRPSTTEVVPVPGTQAVAALERHPDLRAPDGLMVLRPDAPVFFVNAAWIRDSVREQVSSHKPPPRVVVLDLEATSDFDITSLDMLSMLQRDLGSHGVELWLSNVRASVRALLDLGEVTDVIGTDRIFPDVHEAIRAFEAMQLDAGS